MHWKFFAQNHISTTEGEREGEREGGSWEGWRERGREGVYLIGVMRCLLHVNLTRERGNEDYGRPVGGRKEERGRKGLKEGGRKGGREKGSWRERTEAQGKGSG